MKVFDLEHDARRIFTAGVDAVRPEHAMAAAGVRDVVAEHVDAATRIGVLAFGKASVGMMREVLEIAPRDVDTGLMVVHDEHGPRQRPAWLPQQIEMLHGGHPKPTRSSVEAGRRALELAGGLGEGDVLVALISGGGSAMTAAFVRGVTLIDVESTTAELLASGADIAEINCIRKHLSTIAGGRLAAAAFPARVLALAISDVPGDDPAVIASGPVSADTSTFQEALDVARRRDVALPASVRRHLERGVNGRVEETLKPDDARLSRVRYHIIASNALALEAAHAEAERLGYQVVRDEPLVGEARDRAREFAGRLGICEPGSCLLAGGETTVTLGPRPGLGGRNQEFALAAALAMPPDASDWCMLSGGTDGIDGVTDAAGGIICSNRWPSESRELLRARTHLQRHDAHPFLESLESLLVTGASGTNVMDLAIGLRARASES